jgi:hypothetical protein
LRSVTSSAVKTTPADGFSESIAVELRIMSMILNAG